MRLRQLWDKYQLKAYKLCKKAKVLQKKFNNLNFNNKAFDLNPIVDSNDEYNFSSRSYISGQFTSATSNQFIHLPKLQMPVNIVETTVQVRNHKKYLDDHLFYGNRDDKEK